MRNENLPELIAQTAKTVFGIESLYPEQTEVISRIVESSKNRICILPTGRGKTFCFVIPALLLDGITIVVYPLLALMSDQKRRLESYNIPCALFCGGQSPDERKNQLCDLRNGITKIVLTNPETLLSRHLTDELVKCNISHFVIDEAHCVFDWGTTFRSSYLLLKDVIEKLKPHSVTAFTATASELVKDEIQKLLFAEPAEVYQVSSDRSNIHYSVIPCAAKKKKAAELVLTEKRPTLIFCGTHANTESLGYFLFSFVDGENVRFYHAGLEKEEKKAVEEWFFHSKDGILVSTCAYGMGVDKKDIRTVIHYDVPSSAEAYLQEAGRAGRDGRQSKAILLYSPDDLEQIVNSGDERRKFFEDYVKTRTCRRKLLLQAMDEDDVPTGCSGCDNCDGQGVWECRDLIKAEKFYDKFKYTYSGNALYQLICDKFNVDSLRDFNTKMWEVSDMRQMIATLKKKGNEPKRLLLNWLRKILPEAFPGQQVLARLRSFSSLNASAVFCGIWKYMKQKINIK